MEKLPEFGLSPIEKPGYNCLRYLTMLASPQGARPALCATKHTTGSAMDAYCPRYAIYLYRQDGKAISGSGTGICALLETHQV